MSTPQSTEKSLQSFSFTAAIKTKVDDVDAIGDVYPGVHTLSCSSRAFSSYDECASSCRQFMDDILKRVNGDTEKFRLGSEINPVFSGQLTISKDWGLNEVARLWVFDKEQEGKGHIHAIGQARIYGATISTSPLKS